MKAGEQLPLYVTLTCSPCVTGDHKHCLKIYCACECGIQAPSGQAKKIFDENGNYDPTEAEADNS